MNASNTPLLLTPVAIATPVIAPKKLIASSTPTRPRKPLILIQKPLPALKLSPTARIFDQLNTTTTAEKLKHYETQLLALIEEKQTVYPVLWQSLISGSTQAKSLAVMVFLRSGNQARTWINTQLQDADAMALVTDRWVVDFLKHQFSL